jgi:hypothetical protein
MFLHGAIHLAGTAKSFGCKIPQISKDMSVTTGSFWLISALLFMAASILLLARRETWFLVAIMAMISSQVLVILDWTDAKWGTVVNLIILLAVIAEYYNNAVSEQ